MANSSSSSSSMAELMAKTQQSVKALHKGDQLEGTITKLTPSQILVDIGGKSEALVLEKEKKNMRIIMATLHVGDKVRVGVLTPESDAGVPVVALRYFMEDKAWDELEDYKKKQTPIDVTVTEIAKGGAVVETKSGLSGFLPQSHMQFSQNQNVAVGKLTQLHVLELNRKEKRIIFSQKSALTEEQFAKIASAYPKGTKATGQIANVTNFGLFVNVPVEGQGATTQVDGLIHISEIAWEKVMDLGSMFTAGQSVDAVVIGSNAETRRLDLSIKQLTKDPFVAIAEKYPVDMKIKGVVTQIIDGNVYVNLEDPKPDEGQIVEAVIKKEKVPPTLTFKPEDKVNATVSEVDPRRRRISLVPVLTEKPIGYR